MKKTLQTALLLFALLLAFVVPTRSAIPGYRTDISLYLPLALRNAEHVAWIGPDGGTITALAVDPQQSEVIYAATWGAGVFKSIDGGETWHSASRGLGTLFLNSLAVDPKKSEVLYAGTYRGKLYKSTDAGTNWYLSSQGVQDEAIVYAIAVDPLNTQIVYIATRGVSNQGLPPWRGVVYKSVNAGETWVPSLIDVGGSTLQDWVYSLSIHPMAPNILYAAAHEQGPYRSLDAGLSWEVVENGITDTSGRAVAVDPFSNLPAVLYFGVWHGGGVFKSTDGGEVWSQVSNGVYGNKVFSIAIDPLVTSTLYLGTITAGVMKTVDGGENWATSGLYNEEIFALAVNPANHQVVYAGTVASGLYRSLTAGEGWKLSQKGLKGSPVTALVMGRTQPQTYFASSLENGVSISTDQGKTWLDYSTDLPDRAVYALVAHPTQENVYYALTGSSGLYRRQVDSMNGWVPVGEGLPSVAGPAMEKEALEPAYPHFFSDLEGTDQITAQAPLLTMAFAPADDSVVYLGTNGFGVYKSLDGGLSWSPAGLSTETVRTLAVDLYDAQTIYAATDEAGGLQTSIDGGSNWMSGGLPERVVHAIILSEGAEHTIYAGTDNGVYRHTDTGWSQSGLSGLIVQAITVHPTVDGLVFAAAENGAYLSRDGGLHWSTASPELAGAAVSSILIDAHDPRLVFFITPAHGILRVQLSLGD